MTLTATTKSALVWGARGFIGTHLVAELLAQGWKVTVLTRPAAAPPPPWLAAVRVITLDPDDRGRAFDAAIDGVQAVFNLAGSSGAVASNHDPLESLESTCRLQLEFLGACARAAARPHVVFASSRLVYAQAGREPVTEEHPLAPLSVYAAHKLCIEHYHRIFATRGALTFTLCRISNPFGLDAAAAGKSYGFINSLIHRAIAAQPLTLFGRGEQLRDYLYIDDLVRVLRLCAEREEARNELFNIGRGVSLPIRAAAQDLQRALGGGPLEYRPWPADYEAVEAGDFVIDISKAGALLGFVPAYSFRTGLEAVRARVAAAAPAGLPPRVTAAISVQG